MKILLIIPTLSSGGAERVISTLANEWANKNNEVHLIIWNNSKQFYNLNENIVVNDLNFKYKNKFEKLYKEIILLIKMRNLIKKISPSFVLSFLTHTNISVLLSSLFLNKNIIISERNSPEIIKKQLSPFKVLLRILLYKTSSGIIVQSELAKNFIRNEFPNLRVVSLSNPIKKIQNFEEKIKREKIILNVGRLTEQKGQKDLIEIFSKLKSSDWKLIILGEGKLRKTLEEQINDLNLCEKIFLLGEVENVDYYMKKAEIFAFTSYFEGFPNALAEAMSYGLASISYDCNTGPRELIKNEKNGFLIKLNDKDDYLIKLQKLITDENLISQFSKESEKVKKQLSTEKIANQYLNFALKKETI